MNKQILDKLAKLNVENGELYRKKAKLEEAILQIDIQLYALVGEYDKLVKSLLNG